MTLELMYPVLGNDAIFFLSLNQCRCSAPPDLLIVVKRSKSLYSREFLQFFFSWHTYLCGLSKYTSSDATSRKPFNTAALVLG